MRSDLSFSSVYILIIPEFLLPTSPPTSPMVAGIAIAAPVMICYIRAPISVVRIYVIPVAWRYVIGSMLVNYLYLPLFSL